MCDEATKLTLQILKTTNQELPILALQLNIEQETKEHIEAQSLLYN